MACVMTLLREHVRVQANARWRRLLIFGFEENHNTEQICLGLQLLVQNGLEWRHNTPIFILGANVKAAFDELSLDQVMEALSYWGFPGDLIAALVEEGFDLKAAAHLQGEVFADLPFTRSVRQGGIESAWEWNLVVRRILDSFYDR